MTKFRRIATEEAFATPEQLRRLSEVNAGSDSADAPFWTMLTSGTNPFANRVARQLVDIEDERLRAMDALGVDMHLLALTSPGVQMFETAEAVDMAARSNDYLADLCTRHPTRFAGLATIAPQDPAAAAKEIERACGQLGLNGIMINSHTNDEYLDEDKFLPIFEAASALEKPIYIHPRAPSRGMAEPYMKYGLANAIWGYGAETGLHGVRLIMSSVFDRFPNLRIVLGHMGEGLPFWQWRLDYMYTNGSSPRLSLTPGEYMRRNMAITTSGMNWDKALAFCIDAVGIDNIMWAVDYPYQEHPSAVEFMDAVDLPDADKAKLYHGNAERIFGIAPA